MGRCREVLIVGAGDGDRPGLLDKVAATEAGIESRPLSFVERLQAVGLCA
ncbi:MAG: hypothetical protein HY581_02675 [Nitrospirae bacterium]|nr:hypothetical protein [Nitrospirota bacterium]